MRRRGRHAGSPLTANSLYAMAGGLMFAAAQFGFVYVLTVRGSTTIGGRFAWGLAMSTPVFLLCNLGLLSAQTAADPYPGVAIYQRVRMMTIGVACLVAGAAVIAFAPDGPTRDLALAVTLMKAPEALSDVCYGAFQRAELLRHTAVSLASRGVLGLAAGSVVFEITANAVWAVVAMGAAWASVAIAHDVRLAATIERDPQATPTGFEIARTSAPLGVSAAAGALIPNLPRLMVERSLGTAALGVLAPFMHLARIHQLVVGSIGQATISRLAHHYRAGDVRGFRTLLARTLLVAILIGAVVVAIAVPLGDLVLTGFFGSEFGDRTLLALLVVATTTVSVSGLLGGGVIATGSFWLSLVIDLATLAAVVALAAWLIPARGLHGFALALCAGYGFGLIAHLVTLAVLVPARVGEDHTMGRVTTAR